ncbi:MAG: hypothetical protein E7571_01505 [Ruminococcaceae bacterium]|nr:hypothetical protein [Oscillospiraceae bacterium]
MRLKNLSEKDIKKLSDILAPKMTQRKFFKFLCPDSSEREEFINAYLRYNIPRWLQRGDFLLTDENFDVLLVVASPRRSSHKFSGKGAKRMKKFKSAPAIFYYRGNLAYLIHLIAPRNKRLKVMTVFAAKEHDEELFKLIDEAIALSYKYDFNLMYDTLSRRLIDRMKEKGFVVTYQKMFASTGYVQTLMMLNKQQ